MKHTPGPWFVGFVNHRVHVFSRRLQPGLNPERFRVADVGTEDSPQANANARLIVAAPDMADALEAVLESNKALSRIRLWAVNACHCDVAVEPENDAHGDECSEWVALKMAKAALAKAEGR